MKILVINGDCLQVNTSANLCHLAYIQGLLDAGHEVTLLSADGRDYITDESMSIPKEVKSYTYYGVSFYEKLSLKKKQIQQTNNEVYKNNHVNGGNHKNIKFAVDFIKKRFLALYGVHGVYATFVRKAQKFESNVEYDYILSISTPVTSHLLAHNLIKAGRIKGKCWIQIWEDPWYSDAYGFNSNKKIFKEERRLLSLAEKVCYVSPLTLKNQQKLYSESANKMYWQPLPYYYKADEEIQRAYDKNRYGYFGDYAPAARNLEPFYEAAKKCGIDVNICGNPNDLFVSTEHIHIHPRLPLNRLKPIEDNTNVLVFLCNRKGGQIPGKIYQYSATNKTILFILDGTEEEQDVLKSYFATFNRYVFCKNTVKDISMAIQQIESGNMKNLANRPLENFNPKETIRKILEGC